MTTTVVRASIKLKEKCLRGLKCSTTATPTSTESVNKAQLRISERRRVSWLESDKVSCLNLVDINKSTGTPVFTSCKREVAMLRRSCLVIDVDLLELTKVGRLLMGITFPLLLKTSGPLSTGICK